MSAPESVTERLDELLERAQRADRLPSVSAAVFRDGAPLWQRAIGLADVASGTAATPDHQYRIGSITKTFTAVAIMQLRDAGRLDLDAPLRAALPEFPHGPTLRQALSHTTGLQREPPGEIWESLAPPDREQLVAGLEDAERVLAPGVAWHYSNLVFALLGEIVARLGGTYETVLAERVLVPLGLARTRLHATAPAATPYFVEPYSDAVRVEPDLEVTESTGAAGWLWSTTGDLARWADFLCTGADEVLSRATLDEMARVQTMVDETGWTIGWGLGLELVRRGERVLVGHVGAMPGFLAAVFVDRARRIGAAVLTNSGAGTAPDALALDLAEAALDGLHASTDLWSPDAGAPDDVAALLGPWWTEGEQIVLRWRGERLRAELVGGPAGRSESVFAREGDDRWRVVEGRERGEVLRVVRDGDGAPTKLYFATYPMLRAPSTFGAASA
ncbi:MAG: serine hydrolase domain-containing protein [Gaiella sp.]